MIRKAKVQMFGEFCLKYDEKKLDEEHFHSPKLIQLLAYFIMNRDRNITYHELMDVLWENQSKNPQSALKNLVYRLRTLLKELGEDEFIGTAQGTYRWNPQIPVETDYEYFEELYNDIRNEKERNKIISLGEKVILCYRGNITNTIGNDTWILSKNVWYHSKYLDIVKKLGSIYESEEKWDELEAVCRKALFIDSMDFDLHYWIVRSLWNCDKKYMALQHYESVSKVLSENMGENAIEKIQAIFNDDRARNNHKIICIDDLINEMKEERPKGAFFCDYYNFRQIYKMEVRRQNRFNIAEYIILFTLRRSGGVKRKRNEDSSLIEAVMILEKLLRDFLRMGDVVVKYGVTQYIVLLRTRDYETGKKVAERIRNIWAKHTGSKKVELIYEVEELTNPFIEF